MKTITLLALSALTALGYKEDSCDVAGPARIDCGFSGMRPEDCLIKGCCWEPATVQNDEIFKRMLQGKMSANEVPSNDTPWCFYKGDSNVCKNFNFESETAGFEGVYDGIYSAFLDNINIDGKGGVVASPDPNTPGGSYIYHWMRDAGLTMRAFMKINDYDLSAVQDHMESYLRWVEHVQHEDDPNDNSVLIEPKFELPNGEPYTGGWCRPQTDGPGIRSGAVIQYAEILLKNDQESQVKQYIWDIIQTDLDWIVTGWESEGCDLWEEVRSTDFFWNRMSFYQSLTWGAKLATTLGFSDKAATYTETANTIKPTILEHYNGTYVIESTNREKDSAVVHAFVELNEGVFDITGKEVAGTIETLNKLFCYEYQINQTEDENGTPGILYGRYENDSYAGGNPWQLLTAALAEAFYQGAESMVSRNDDILQESEVAHWRNILELSEKPTAKEFAAAANSAGNAVMFRMWNHVKDDVYQLAEQMNRNTGDQLSAKSLTWSFSNVLKNIHSYIENDSLKSLNNYKKE